MTVTSSILSVSNDNTVNAIIAASASITSNSITVLDKFLGDDIVKGICSKIRKSDVGTDSVINVNTLNELILRGNCISAESAESLGELVRDCSRILTLSLEWNQLGSRGVCVLADYLYSSTSLLTLDLRNNSIDDEGAQALAQMLIHNQTIRTLDLRWNLLSDIGVTAFKDAVIKRNSTDKSNALSILFAGNTTSSSVLTHYNSWLSSSSSAETNDGQGDITSEGLKLDGYGIKTDNSLLKTELINMRKQLLQLQTCNIDLQRQCDLSLIRVVELEANTGALEFRCSSLEEEVSKRNRTIETQSQEYKVFVTTMDTERQQLRTTYSADINRKEEEIITLSRVIDELKSTVTSGEAEREQLQWQLSSKVETIDAHRVAHTNEVSALTKKLNDTIASDSAIRSEYQSVKCTCDRLNERLRGIEADNTREVEIQRLHGELEQLSQECQLKSNEILLLNGKVVELESSLLSQQIRSSNEASLAITAAVYAEKSRHEAALEGFKTKLDAYTSIQSALERRCNELSQELIQVNEANTTETKGLLETVRSRDIESSRQQKTVSQLREQLHTSDTENKQRYKELEECKIKMLAALDESESSYHLLQEAITERQHLRSKIVTLEGTVATLKENRSKEYSTIVQNISNAINSEFESIKINLKIKN